MQAFVEPFIEPCSICGKEKFLLNGGTKRFHYKYHWWCWFKLLFTEYRGDIVYFINDTAVSG